MVLHKLVNSTNVVFHMLDLQPYAMVLPMDKLTSEKSKRKILYKVYKNNPDTYAAFKSTLKSLKLKNPTKPKNKIKEEDTQNPVITHKEHAEVEESQTHADTKTSEDAEKFNPSKVEVMDVRDREKLNNSDPNHEMSTFQQPEPLDVERGVELPDDIFSGVRRFLDRIDSEQIIGCMIILAPRTLDKSSICPIAGGIVEVFDDYERSIQTMWLNNDLANFVKYTNLKGKKNSRKLIDNMNDQILGRVIISALTLRLCAHAYQMTLPNSKRIQHKSRLISVYHQMGLTFPNFAYNFIKEEMQFSKHYEITTMAIKHNDNPKIPCKCLKPTPSDPGYNLDQGSTQDNSPLFFGITESRFSAMYTSTYEPILMGFMNLLSGKLNDVSKIVRFEESVVSYYIDDDDDFTFKRKKINLRSKRLQNKM